MSWYFPPDLAILILIVLVLAAIMSECRGSSLCAHFANNRLYVIVSEAPVWQDLLLERSWILYEVQLASRGPCRRRLDL